jgi:ATP-dependent Zn protease
MCCDAPNVNYLKLLLDWVPFLIFIGLLVFFMRRMGGSAGEMKRYREDCLAEQRRLSAAAERIAAALEQRGRQ